jgi:hypothetical protein
MQNQPAEPHHKRRWPREEVTTVEPLPEKLDDFAVAMDVAVVADLQDSLLVAMNDLKRLEGLLDHATANLLDRFNAAMQALEALPQTEQYQGVRQALHQAVTELQFHDMANQLLVHTGKVLKGCAYSLAEQTMAPEEDEIGTVVTLLPQNPNPVTQSEMDAGSVELF